MKLIRHTAIALGLVLLGGCVTPVGPVEVTRFLAEDVSPLGKGTIAVQPAVPADAASLEWQAYGNAVMHELHGVGYAEAAPGAADQIATVRLVRSTIQPDGTRSPVSVGVGGQTGSYGSGVGMGIGINLSPKPKAMVATEMAVAIRQRSTGRVLWEGRASFSAASGSPLADSGLAAPKMAAALFQDFPGRSGETVLVK